MICFETNIDYPVQVFFQKNINVLLNHSDANDLIRNVSGINNFFQKPSESLNIFNNLQENLSIVAEPDRREYGDFQTNEKLAYKVASYAYSKESNIEFVLEPTCGKGNFILASIKLFTSLKKIVGVEIYQPYTWETKFKILSHYLSNPISEKPEIDIYHANAFDFPYKDLAVATRGLKTMIIGNPPWVTNSELSSIDSGNLPLKSNFKKHNGLEAMTGKGNFDIGENITLIMLDCFHEHDGLFAFLIKNSVIKNIVQDQKRNNYRIAGVEKLNIDSKREFNVSVNASLFLTRLNQAPELTCREFDFYTNEPLTSFGWYKDKYVFSIDDYDMSGIIDGKSVFIWRSGIKHDCSKIMEIEEYNGHFINGLKQEIDIEKDLVYGLLKSSDLKESQQITFRKLTIVTQRKIGEETEYIENKFPLTYSYLAEHKEYFDKRKSSIYRDKPDFSIFGVGEYSFAPFKVAISGMYKSTHFTLVKTNKGKPIMLDDTCYFIGFDNFKFAQIAHYLLNTDLVQGFLKSIIFSDSKRSITKDILMRIDFERAFERESFNKAQKYINGILPEDWSHFGKLIAKPIVHEQLTLF